MKSFNDPKYPYHARVADRLHCFFSPFGDAHSPDLKHSCLGFLFPTPHVGRNPPGFPMCLPNLGLQEVDTEKG